MTQLGNICSSQISNFDISYILNFIIPLKTCRKIKLRTLKALLFRSRFSTANVLFSFILFRATLHGVESKFDVKSKHVMENRGMHLKITSTFVTSEFA